MAGLLCDCCRLPVPPFGGGDDECACPCDMCRGEQICFGCREMVDSCVCDDYEDEDDL